MANYHDNDTDSTIAVYVNSTAKQIYIAFAGSVGNAWFTDDVDIFLGKTPRSITKQEIQDFLQKQFDNYPNMEFNATGHSRGATQASVASDLFGFPAIVYDNSGVSHQQGYQFPLVTSIQSSPNLVNTIGTTTMRNYDYGNIKELTATPANQLLDVSLQGLSNALHIPIVSAAAFVGKNFFSHTNKNIGKNVAQFNKKLQQESKKAVTQFKLF